MECAVLVTTVGLVMDIIGAVMLYIYGAPVRQETKDGNMYLPVNFGTDEEKAKRKQKYDETHRRSEIAIWLLGSGFVLQLIGNII